MEYRVVDSVPINRMSDIVLATPKLDEEYANALLLRAASGVKIKLVTCDREWGPWLDNQRRSYGLVEENIAKRGVEKCRGKAITLSRLSILIPFIVVVLMPVTYLRLPIHLLVVPPMAALAVALLVELRKLSRDARIELQLKVEGLERLKIEIGTVREEIRRSLEVVQAPIFTGTVVVHSEGAFFTSADLTTVSLKTLSAYQELKKEDGLDLIRAIGEGKVKEISSAQ
ncbi:hypothetical protein HS1genome_2190 [Sulfodiicoccus acidiphilus]|uniref:Uncharacterized protein n=1 Tax=Sulfodiicoccus acidiphilus TaxID=1670455 RepID=A0A348B6J9_9CREN|nr:hypothetical protein [Sulfodiicoccus acidiphilus]BBD73801.1 hypothetical protein HS1genome_2190 [Sulfodiicoccus acidiphilus]GGU03630.1 hypothetical protein GCM10007116_20610 [Sulfodiicoccus acidiphilus]